MEVKRFAIVTGSDASEALELVEGPSDRVALLVEVPVLVPLLFAVGLRRDDGDRAKPFDLSEHPPSVS